MLEIDGEFFEDPCEMILAERYYEILLTAKQAAFQLAAAFHPYFTTGGIIDSDKYKGDIIHVK